MFRTDDNLAISGLVRGGSGAALVSRLELESKGDDLIATPVGRLIGPRRIGLAWSRSRALLPHRDRLVGAIREICAGSDSVVGEQPQDREAA